MFFRVFDQLPTLASPLVTGASLDVAEKPLESTTLTFASGRLMFTEGLSVCVFAPGAGCSKLDICISTHLFTLGPKTSAIDPDKI